jgi:hypothetical protein
MPCFVPFCTTSNAGYVRTGVRCNATYSIPARKNAVVHVVQRETARNRSNGVALENGCAPRFYLHPAPIVDWFRSPKSGTARRSTVGPPVLSIPDGAIELFFEADMLRNWFAVLQCFGSPIRPGSASRNASARLRTDRRQGAEQPGTRALLAGMRTSATPIRGGRATGSAWTSLPRIVPSDA